MSNHWVGSFFLCAYSRVYDILHGQNHINMFFYVLFLCYNIFMNNLERYYEKFNEDKRLKRKHGQVEFFVTMEYIKKYLKKFDKQSIKIADIGAGTGAYAVELANGGFNVTAVEYVKKNLDILKSKQVNVKTYLGDAKNLNMLKDNTFDITLLFGPIYHSTNFDDKIKILKEAKRITKSDGLIFVAYYMNDYAVLLHGFRDDNIKQSFVDGIIDKNFKIISNKDDLYSFERLEDINKYNKFVGLKRIKIFAPDGASDYIRDVLNKLDDKTFELFKKYQLKVSSKKELLGASSHLVDIVKNIK